MGKKNAVVLFGGQSSEHVVSCMSVINVINHINREIYDLLLIGITEDGHWIKTDSVEAIQDGSWKNGSVSAVLSPDATMKSVILLDGEKTELVRADVVFPVLHGLYGEDGTIQGLLELSGIPYVGCGVLSSAVSMDKLYTKIIVKDLGVRQADYIAVMRHELHDLDPIVKKVEDKFTYPVFVKPSNAGSSKGVSRAEDGKELKEALILAGEHDRKILVEEMIVGREIECAVFGGGNTPVEASGVGEIVAAAEFYDFDAKYYNSESKTVVDPTLPEGAAETIKSAAKAIFQAVDGYGLARVDFFVKEDGTVVFNEINTMPGFTAISMYPMLWEHAGITKEELVNRLLKHAADRSQS
ncbi:MAG: D-alanine--D-alanine ligase [Clostridiales bacterium]|uniref:D-alanine--D-alanine ligase family protein n=1 Tax=Lacrimispora sp. TaxID=2719234 RepID=UPI0028AD6916|nr:D-alanine--D-alanine ligase family protein [Lacrimispora sp.]MBS5956810.1 D-alanine--D-alanine ligase [Clostridiales bacterium]